MSKKTLAPKQARSRESLARLLAAAEAVLGEKGLDGATIPRIAAKASLTPGAVYRRFRSKDALLQRVALNMLEQSDANVRKFLIPEEARDTPLPVLIDRIVRSLLYSHRLKAGVVRALMEFARDHPSTAFRKQVNQLETQTFRRIIDYLSVHRAEVKHHDPELALSFGTLMVVFAVRELVLMPGSKEEEAMWAQFLPRDDIQLQRELSRALQRYLGTSEPGRDG